MSRGSVFDVLIADRQSRYNIYTCGARAIQDPKLYYVIIALYTAYVRMRLKILFKLRQVYRYAIQNFYFFPVICVQ